jgi:hypothetical protein
VTVGKILVRVQRKRETILGLSFLPQPKTARHARYSKSIKGPALISGVPALEPQTEFVFGKNELSFLARAAIANHFSGKSKFSSIDFSLAPVMAPLGRSVDLFGDGSLWAISVPGHTDDDVAYLINSATPVLLTGDASHFA